MVGWQPEPGSGQGSWLRPSHSLRYGVQAEDHVGSQQGEAFCHEPFRTLHRKGIETGPVLNGLGLHDCTCLQENCRETIHSGRMMNDCLREVLRYRPASICTYSLVLKRGSTFIPTMWGLMVNDVDRAFFLLPAIPNNRLSAGNSNSPQRKKGLNVHLRILSEEHLTKPSIVTGIPSMDRATWGDRLFDMQASGDGRCSYVLEKAEEVIGYLTLSGAKDGTLSIDELAVDEKYRGYNLGATLMRFSDTMARALNCKKVSLQAISNRRDYYERFSYEVVAKAALRLDQEEYWLMEKPVVHAGSFLKEL